MSALDLSANMVWQLRKVEYFLQLWVILNIFADTYKEQQLSKITHDFKLIIIIFISSIWNNNLTTNTT